MTTPVKTIAIGVTVDNQMSSTEAGTFNSDSLHTAKVNEEATNLDKDKKSEDQKKAIQGVQKAVGAGASLIQGIMSGTFDLIQQMYQKLKQSSPLLETIESLFNLAMTLLFMPLGNALGETFIPMAIDLVDNVLSMWETFDEQFNNGDLSGMLTAIMTTGVQYIGQFIEDIGESLENQGGLLGTIGRLIDKLGEFIQNDLEKVISGVLSIVTFILEHIKEFISTYVGLKTTEFGYMLAQIAMTAAASVDKISTTATMAALVLPLAAGTAAGLGTEGYLSSIGLAEGGRAPATEGGRLYRLGERGEDEIVTPVSKLESLSNVTNNSSSAKNVSFTFTGYNDDQLVQKVRELIREELLNSNYTGLI